MIYLFDFFLFVNEVVHEKSDNRHCQFNKTKQQYHQCQTTYISTTTFVHRIITLHSLTRELYIRRLNNGCFQKRRVTWEISTRTTKSCQHPTPTGYVCWEAK